MKCPRNKPCQPMSLLRAKSCLICVGFNDKPLKYKKDKVTLCLSGVYVKNLSIQMTCKEALLIGTGLLNLIGME